MLKKKILILIAILLTAIFIAEFAFKKEPQVAAEDFVTALTENNNPQQYCTGEALYRVETRDAGQAEILSLTSRTTERSNHFARVYIEIEMQFADQKDVGFYELDLIKDTDWKVFSVREVMPKLGMKTLAGSSLEEEIEQVYQKYFKKISENDPSLLAGPAKTAFEKQLYPIKIEAEITDLETEIIGVNGKIVLAKHTYRCDDRKVVVFTQYYKTQEGYKVVSVQEV